LILACDTTVLLDGEMLNKPVDAGEARSMLRRLRGRVHEVQSAIVLRHGEEEVVDVVTSRVLMRGYGDDEIEAYIESGDPFDKAGSYAVQHAEFRPVAEIRGCPLNVIGLSLCHVRARLPWLPESGPVCEAMCGRACPARLDDPEHVVPGRLGRV
jgi:MAF protein